MVCCDWFVLFLFGLILGWRFGCLVFGCYYMFVWLLILLYRLLTCDLFWVLVMWWLLFKVLCLVG